MHLVQYYYAILLDMILYFKYMFMKSFSSYSNSILFIKFLLYRGVEAILDVDGPDVKGSPGSRKSLILHICFAFQSFPNMSK